MRPLALALGLAIATASSVRADPAETAQEHIDRATAAHKEGRLADALAELTTAYTLDPRPELLYAIGQVHLQLGRCTEAIRYYQRFLDTNPKPATAAATRKAIESCKNAPPPATTQPAPVPEPAPRPDPAPATAPEPRPALVVVESQAPWYSDHLGVALAAGGAFVGVGSLVAYGAARSTLGDANTAPTYQRQADLYEAARLQRTYAVVAGAAGAALVGVGIVHIVVADRTRRETRRILVAPTAGGVAMSLGGSW